MTAVALIMLAIKASLALTVFAIGLRAGPGDGTWLFRHPALLARSVLSMNIIMPTIAICTAVAFTLEPAVKIALIALSISPVPPIFPRKASQASGESPYGVALFVAISLLAIVVVPASVWFVGQLRGTPFSLSPNVVGGLIGKGIVLPLLAGMVTKRLAPGTSGTMAKEITALATIVLVIALIPLLIWVWPEMKTLIGNVTLAAIAIISVIGLGVGHLLGGPDSGDRTVLALATAMRHPAIAIAIAQATFPDNALVPAAVILNLIVVAILTRPYIRWTKRTSTDWAPPSLAFPDRRQMLHRPTAVSGERRVRRPHRHDRH